jgi:hypothetical protein
MAVSQALTVTEVAGSPSVANNTSQVRILWQSTQTYDSYNGYTRTAKYYISINGGPETEYSVSYTLPKQTTQTILDKTITVPHNDDGSGTVKVRTWMDTDISAGIVEKSQTIQLTDIARASEITSAAAITLGNGCSVKWTPRSMSFRYKLKFSLGDWSYTTPAIHPNKTSDYTYNGYKIPLSVANQIPDAKTGAMKVTLYTYSDSGATAQVGDGNSTTFTVTVPENTSTKPTLVIVLEPVSSLGIAFDGLYIQGKTKVKATIVAEGKYGATIKSTTMSVEGKSYDAGDSYTSDFLASYGDITVTTVAKDSRGFNTTLTSKIPVIAYSKPKITVSMCGRCDANSNLTDDGTYLKIKASRSYTPVKSGDNQKNFCKIRYRYKLTTASAYSSWETILEGDMLNSDTVETDALLGGVLALNASYFVQVQAVDDIGESAESMNSIPTETVYMHRTKNAMGLGKYAEGENLLDVGWDARFHGEVLIGPDGKTLKEYILSVIREGE